MNDKPAEKPKKKKGFLSIPFLIIGVLLIGCLVPILNDFDHDEKRDSISKYVMFKVMATQEKAKEAEENGMYEHPEEIESKRDKTQKPNTVGPDFAKGETGGFGPRVAPKKSEKKKRPETDEEDDSKSDEDGESKSDDE